VNFSKSKIRVVEVGTVQSYIKILNCNIISIPFSYLRMVIGGNPLRCDMWKMVVDKIRKRLAKWKRMNLSFARRVW